MDDRIGYPERNMEGMQAYGAGKAGGAFDPVTFFQQPQTILRIVSWVSEFLEPPPPPLKTIVDDKYLFITLLIYMYKCVYLHTCNEIHATTLAYHLLNYLKKKKTQDVRIRLQSKKFIHSFILSSSIEQSKFTRHCLPVEGL